MCNLRRSMQCTFLLLLASLLIAPSAGARSTMVTATGQGVILKGNTQAAEAQATASAYRNALEQVAASLGGPKEGEDASLDETLYDHAAAFVINSSLQNRRVDGNILFLELNVEVSTDAIREALGGRRSSSAPESLGTAAKLSAMDGKRILILVSEQLGPQRIISWRNSVFTPHFVASKTTMMRQVTELGGMEAAFSDGFNGAGFKVIDPHVLSGKLSPKPAFQVLDLSNNTSRSIAQKSNADLVVVAKGVAQINRGAQLGGGMLSGQANVVARLIRVRDGKVLATATQHAAQVHIDSDTAMLGAVSEAARLAAGELIQKISAN